MARKDKDVAFIRKGGRVIPIRKKRKEDYTAARVGAASAGVGAVAGVHSPLKEEFKLRNVPVIDSPEALKKVAKSGDVVLYGSSVEGKAFWTDMIEASMGSKFVHASILGRNLKDLNLGTDKFERGDVAKHIFSRKYTSEAVLFRPTKASAARGAASRAERLGATMRWDIVRALKYFVGGKLTKSKCKKSICFDLPSQAYGKYTGDKVLTPKVLQKSSKFAPVARVRNASTFSLTNINRYVQRGALGATAFGAAGYLGAKLYQGVRDERR